MHIIEDPKQLEHVDLNDKALIQHILKRHEGELSQQGAIAVKTGARTGRSPDARAIVADDVTQETVDWGKVNHPFTPEAFEKLWAKGLNYLENKERFISHFHVGADPNYAISVKVITELAWHNLFVRHLFITPKPDSSASTLDTWTLLCVPGLQADPAQDATNSDAAILLDFSKKRVFICGTYYAGEMKKAMFSVLNYLLPSHKILPMHCAANVGESGDVALFFGLSGTGKTTLSSDPDRYLIGDDEHGWSDHGIFNFEGGCYAKCIDLSAEREPVIWQAIRDGAIMENVVIDANTKIPDYSDTRYTQNTRAAYPRTYIEKRVIENCAGQPNAILFLSCDLYGVLPPVARLNKEQAAYYFLSGYTALVGSTEVGQTPGVKPTFSTCFGAPFFPRPARVYADLLIEKIEKTGAQVFLVNTGWTGGAYGQGGKRFDIPVTRQIVHAILDGALNNTSFERFEKFNLEIPTQLAGVENTLLNPERAWKDKDAFVAARNALIEKFVENFKRFDVDPRIAKAGPTLS